jgi:hypothetical protein
MQPDMFLKATRNPSFEWCAHLNRTNRLWRTDAGECAPLRLEVLFWGWIEEKKPYIPAARTKNTKKEVHIIHMTEKEGSYHEKHNH